MKSLVLAEKPSVAREIARVLGCTNKNKSYIEGPKYVVSWALGHLVGLSEPEDYDPKYKTWNLEDLPIMPGKMTLKPLKETAGQFRAVLQLCRRSDISELIIATDSGREGELVARWIMELAHWKKPFKRLWISSQTDKAIKDGFASLKPGRDYDRLYASAVCRAEADWLVGLNVTRALTSKYNAQLSAGRVQTPTLAMMMDREREINGFQPKPYWTVSADFGEFQAAWRSGDGHDGRLWERAEAEAIIARTSGPGKQASVEQLRTTERSELHPQAYDLTELQRDANKRLGFSAKQTSNVLQRLYEQHKLVTYPRTDSRYLSSDMVPTLKGRLESVAVGPYAPLARKLLRSPLPVTKRIVDDSKVSDHHAIIPTEQYVNLSALSPEERKLHELIVRRFLALFAPPCRYDETSVVLRVGDDRFYARGNVLKDAGWKEAYGGVQAADFSGGEDDGADEDSSNGSAAGTGGGSRGAGQLLPPLAKGQKLPVKMSRFREQQTQPPARYNEAGLLTKMEKYGLGTPATRADIIEKLLSSQTIDRQGNRLVPTGKGKQLIELVADDLRSPELTAAWERELERIAKGQGDAKRFMADIRQKASAWVNEVKQETKEYKPHNLSHARCPECSKPMIEINGKRGKSLVCQDRECGYRRSAEPALSNKRCPQCRKKMEIHTGKAGKYAQCRKCNVIEMLEDKAGGGGGGRGGRINKHQQSRMVEQFSDKVTLSGGLADALKAALEGKGDSSK
ncbi:DNA topoisomerase III [Paenibacillus curdlanolyticus YK9]|uniref:DNA topoisomerase n=1 Tax=Paenibacillus curdlanolyticus YK9 TaxID=717606 RepID=E0I7V6_9BACL|nr:DNA topoisomerase III [Paenibacillus curdlanolyticus]EFM11261.1 DNA topoisomerase III [Paenibacillus curdlanolyticus YK9]